MAPDGVPRPDSPVQARLLHMLRDEGPLSRADVGQRLGVTRARLAADVERLSGIGLVEHAGPAASRGGRRSTLVRLAPQVRFAGIDLGATSISAEVVDGELTPLAFVEEPADIRDGPSAVLDRVQEILGKLQAEGTYSSLAAIGMGVPGPVSFRDGVPASPPIMPGWDGYPVRDTLARANGCPAAIDNDVNIMIMGERHGGVARSLDDVLFVKIGTGIGCGIIVNGQLYRGNDGCAGDIGHIQADPAGPACSCGHVGCLEAVFGGAALGRSALAVARSGASPWLAERLACAGAVGARDVAEAAAAGDVASLGLIRDGGRAVGAVLAGLVSFFNPSMIVIGGGLSQLGHLLLADIRSVIYRRSLPLATHNLPVVLSELGPRAGVAGASLLASELVFGSPGTAEAGR